MIQPDAPPPPDQKPRRGRPRGAPDASQARRDLIRAGLEHLTERGYSSVGVDEILKVAKVPKGSFYHHFHSKADFGLALIAAYDTYFAGLLDRAFLNEQHTPLERLSLFARMAEDGMARHGFRRGCLVGNLGQEMGALPDDFRGALIAVLETWQRRTAQLFREALACGELSEEHDPDTLAEAFWIGWEGAILRSKLELRPDPLHSFLKTFVRLFETRIPR